ncbi:MAG: DUF951 domain-containing protein [Chloroflexota bacterium]
MEIVDFRIGDVVQLRKVHPCGGYQWDVVRLGADIGLHCRTCGRRVLLPRRTLERRMKKFVQRAPEMEAGQAEETG